MKRSSEPKRRQGAISQVVAKWLPILSRHFGTELSETDYEIYERGLSGVAPMRVDAAFERCLRECQFMPRMREIFERMPEHDPVGHGNEGLERRKLIREWVEPFTRRSNARFYELEGGYRVVRIEPIGPAGTRAKPDHGP